MTVFDTLEGGRDKKNSAALNAFLLTGARKILKIKVLQNFAFFPPVSQIERVLSRYPYK